MQPPRLNAKLFLVINLSRALCKLRLFAARRTTAKCFQQSFNHPTHATLRSQSFHNVMMHTLNAGDAMLVSPWQENFLMNFKQIQPTKGLKRKRIWMGLTHTVRPPNSFGSFAFHKRVKQVLSDAEMSSSIIFAA